MYPHLAAIDSRTKGRGGPAVQGLAVKEAYFVTPKAETQGTAFTDVTKLFAAQSIIRLFSRSIAEQFLSPVDARPTTMPTSIRKYSSRDRR